MTDHADARHSAPADLRLDRQLRCLRAYALLTYPFVCVPFLFLYFADHGLSLHQYGRVIATYYLAMLLAEVPTGLLADWLSRRLMLVLGPMLLAAGFATLWLWPAYPGFALGEALMGLGHSVLSGPPSALLYDLLQRHGVAHRYVAEESRIHAMRLYGTGSSFLLGGVLAWVAGEPGHWNFAATILPTSGLCLGAACLALRLERQPQRPPRSLRQFARGVATDLRLPAVRWLLAYWLLLFALLRFPFHDYQVYLDAAAAQASVFAHPLLVGGLYALLNLVAAPLSQRVPLLVRRHGRRRLFWAMPLLLAASLLVMAGERGLQPQVGGALAQWLPLCGVAMFVVQQVPFGMHWALVQEFVNHRIRADARTTVWSVLSLGGRLGYAGINVLLFDLQDQRGMAVSLAAAGSGGLVLTALVMWLRPRGLLRGNGDRGETAQRPRST